MIKNRYMYKKINIINQLPEPEKNYKKAWDDSFLSVCEYENNMPKITIVTPSYNQGVFVERTIRCILLQGYPNLEYIIIDGGSDDDSKRIIKKYEKWLSYWVSEKDNGMYHAINKGFEKSSGDILAWSPTGDLYEKNALYKIGNVFKQKKQVDWITSLYKIKIDENNNEIKRYKIDGFNRELFYKGVNNMTGTRFARYMIQQQSTFWRRQLWNRTGGFVDESMKGAGDYELWARFYRIADLYAIDAPIGKFMSHNGQESVRNKDRMIIEVEKAFKMHGGKKMNIIEGILREKILRKKILYPISIISKVACKVNLIEWNDEKKEAVVKATSIV